MASAVAESWPAGMVLLGNGLPVAGSTMVFDPKFPERWATVGTTEAMVELPEFALRWRELSQPPKKNVRLRRIRPPRLPPNWFCVFSPSFALKNGRALKALLRRNSYASPWNWLVPLFVVTLMMEPRARPNSAP